MEDHERHAVLMFDEIQLKQGLSYDQATGRIIGRPTISLADGTLPKDAMAKKGFVFMLGGVTTRWKQTIAYHFTGNSFSSTKLKEVLLAILQECEKIGLRVDAIVCDMGGGNQGIWRKFGIVVCKYSRSRVSCPHPCDPGRRLYFMADVPHLLKNLRNHLTRGQSIILPADVVKKHGLPSNEVTLQHVKELVEIDSKLQLNIAPHLKPACLDPGHFEKMKVGLAFSLLNHDTAAALRFLVQRGDMPQDALTTAWFIEVVFKWFKIMTSRTTKLAISKLNEVKYGDTVLFLQDAIRLFESLEIIDPDDDKHAWKPVQTGIILVTAVALELQDYYLNTKGFFCVLLGRFGQDALENLFSTLRTNNPAPKPYEFRCAIRAATMAQFLRPSKDGSYAHDAGFSLVGLDTGSGKAAQVVDTVAVEFPDDVLMLSETEQGSFDYLAGYAVSNVKQNMSCCSECIAAITCKEASTLTRLKSYTKETRLSLPSPAVIQFLETAESLFRTNSDKLLHDQITLAQLEASAVQNVTCVNCFPACHNVATKLLRVFLRTRMHILLRKENQRISEKKASVKCGSRSIGKQVATRNVK